mgnify:CR=1 FL=1
MSIKHYSLLIALLAGIGFWILPQQTQPIQAQPRITNTTVNVVIPEATATSPPQNNAFVEASPSPTFTATPPLPDATLVSVAASGTALIRDFPEDGTVLGVLQDNTQYQVLGQYFSWYQIQLTTVPQGFGWVYFEDVAVSGDFTTIPAVDPNVQPAELSEQDIVTQTAQVLFQTPGFAETATAESRILEVPQETVNPNSDSEFPPTFTPPADMVELQPTPRPDARPTQPSDLDIIDSLRDSVLSGNIPPLLMILGLGVFGTLGMLISAVRR